MFKLNHYKNAKLKVTQGNLLKDTVGVVIENFDLQFENPIDGCLTPPLLFSLEKDAVLVFGVFEDEVEIIDS